MEGCRNQSDTFTLSTYQTKFKDAQFGLILSISFDRCLFNDPPNHVYTVFIILSNWIMLFESSLSTSKQLPTFEHNLYEWCFQWVLYRCKPGKNESTHQNAESISTRLFFSGWTLEKFRELLTGKYERISSIHTTVYGWHPFPPMSSIRYFLNKQLVDTLIAYTISCMILIAFIP